MSPLKALLVSAVLDVMMLTMAKADCPSLVQDDDCVPLVGSGPGARRERRARHCMVDENVYRPCQLLMPPDKHGQVRAMFISC